MYLFIDTTKDITLGVLDQEFNWLQYDYYHAAKGSAQIHAYIHEACRRQNIKTADLDGLVQVAGPGSYTGMRVSDGVSQIFNWQNFKTYGFYHYDVPLILGHQKGVWVANAFKGELFCCRWQGENITKELVDTDKFDISGDEDIYTSFKDDKLDGDLIYTSELIKNNSKKVFSYIISNNIKKELYYYRSIDQEYKSK